MLDRLVEAAADDIRVRRAMNQAEVLRGFAETRYAAKSWDKERRVVARIEASASHADDMLRRGIDIRYARSTAEFRAVLKRLYRAKPRLSFAAPTFYAVFSAIGSLTCRVGVGSKSLKIT